MAQHNLVHWHMSCQMNATSGGAHIEGIGFKKLLVVA
jgi:hypothetical protein